MGRNLKRGNSDGNSGNLFKRKKLDAEQKIVSNDKITSEKKKKLITFYNEEIDKKKEEIVDKRKEEIYKRKEAQPKQSEKLLRHTAIDTVNKLLPKEDLIETVPKSFNVSINLSDIGVRRIKQVLVKGRPPTNYDGKNQGPHIVAYTLFTGVIRGQLVGATLLPNKGKDPSKDAIERLRNLDKTLGTPIDGLNAKLDELAELRDSIPGEKEFAKFVDPEIQESIRKATRSKLSTLRQNINVIVADLITRWNKRDGVVYQFREKIWNRKQVEIFGSDIDSRENSALSDIEGIDTINLKLSQLEFDDSIQDEAREDLERLSNESGDEDIINKVLSRLIDIKPIEEFTLDSFKRQYDDVKDFDEVSKRFTVIYEKAIKETESLGKLAYPNIADKINEKKIKTGLIDAVIEDLGKRLSTIEKKTDKQKTEKDKERLKRYKVRLGVLQKQETKP